MQQSATCGDVTKEIKISMITIAKQDRFQAATCLERNRRSYGKESTTTRIEISGKKEMNRLVNLLVKEGYEVVVYSDSFQRENKTDADRGYIVRYVHPDYDNCAFVAKEFK